MRALRFGGSIGKCGVKVQAFWKNTRPCAKLFIVLTVVLATLLGLRLFDDGCNRKEAYCDAVERYPDYYKYGKGNQTRPKIVVWAKQMHCVGWTLPQLPNGDGGCDLTYDRNEFDQGDAIVFFMKCCHQSDLPDPKRRRKDQAFVWWAQESPWTVRHYYKQKLTEYNDYFNWTMTYRMDSDVIAAMWPIPAMDYVLLKNGRKDDMLDENLLEKPTLPEKEFQREIKHLMSLKKKMVSWIVTNCGNTRGAQERNRVAETIENEGGITIDRFGKCVKKPIPLNNTILLEVLAPYKFYLAFENSVHCQDYLTEKTMINSMVGGNVPIILGPTRENTAKLLPKHSYIHMEDFSDMNELANYLKYLDKNDTAYMEYFNWWKEPGAQNFPRFGFNCGPKYLSDKASYRRLENEEFMDDWQELERFGFYHLCRKLKNKDHLHTTKTVPNVADWFFGHEKPECITRY